MNNQFKQLLNTILVNINNGNYDKSKLLLTYALDINPKNYEVLSLMGYVCAIQKNLEEAEDYLNRALAINPNDAVAIFNLANLLSEHNKFEESIKLLERAEYLYPSKSNLYHLHAKCLAGIGRVSESFNFYQKSLNLSLSLEILFEFCNLLVKNGFIEEAISQYDYASVAHPNRSELYINKGILLHKLRRFNQAINEYDKAIKINPNQADAWSNKGVTLSELRLSEEAKLHFEEAINLRSDYAEAWANLGASLIDLHHYDEALVSLDNAVSLRKNFPEVYGSKALAYRLSKNYYKSAEFYLLAYDQATHDNFYLGQALHQLMLCCDWAKFDEISKKIEEGVNAIYLALNDLEKVKAYKFTKVSPLLGPTKVSCTVIHAGEQHNMVPELCRYVLDVRVNELYSHEEVLYELNAKLSAELIPRSMRLRSSSLPEGHLLHEVGKSLDLEIFGSPTLSDQALIPYPSAKIGPGDSARSHTADEFIFTQEVKDGITTYISILENYASLYLQTKQPQ